MDRIQNVLQAFNRRFQELVVEDSEIELYRLVGASEFDGRNLGLRQRVTNGDGGSHAKIEDALVFKVREKTREKFCSNIQIHFVRAIGMARGAIEVARHSRVQ